MEILFECMVCSLIITNKKILDTILFLVYTITCKENYFTGGAFMELGKKQKDNDELAHILEMSLLYDFYGALLKEHKRQIFEDYILNDYSLGEIAAEQGISRQGVHDIVKRCSKELEHYEDSLHLVEKFQKTKENVNEIHAVAMRVRETKNIEEIEKIETLSNQILEVL